MRVALPPPPPDVPAPPSPVLSIPDSPDDSPSRVVDATRHTSSVGDAASQPAPSRSHQLAHEPLIEELTRQLDLLRTTHANGAASAQLALSKLCARMHAAEAHARALEAQLHSSAPRTRVKCADAERERDNENTMPLTLTGGRSYSPRLVATLAEEKAIYARRAAKARLSLGRERIRREAAEGEIALVLAQSMLQHAHDEDTSAELSFQLEQAAKEQARLQAELDETRRLLRETQTSEMMLRHDYERAAQELCELKGSVRVYCRLRPLRASESARGVAVFAGEPSAAGIRRQVSIQTAPNSSSSDVEMPPSLFAFDRVFSASEGTDELFVELTPLVTTVLNGGNATVLAYGQSGSGKTWTTTALNELLMKALLIGAEEASPRLRLSLAILQVHSVGHAESLTDLLHACEPTHTPRSASAAPKLQVRTGCYVTTVPSLSWHVVRECADALSLAARASSRRLMSDNGVNVDSSRSHMVYLYQLHDEGRPRSQLALVDLAGSERLAHTAPSSSKRAEAVGINSSLTSLGQVMLALINRSAHVPYRNSLLTTLLQPSMRRGSCVAMIVTASPAAEDAEETLVALRFGSRARAAQLGPPTSSANKMGMQLAQAQRIASAHESACTALRSELFKTEAALHLANEAVKLAEKRAEVATQAAQRAEARAATVESYSASIGLGRFVEPPVSFVQ